MSYQTSIKKLNEKLLNLTSSICSDNADINLSKRLTKQTNSLNYASFQINNDALKKLDDIYSTYGSIITESDERKKEINEKLKNDLEVIINDYTKQREIKMLNNLDEVTNIEKEIDKLEQDITYYNLTTIQTITVLNDEYEKTIKRYDEQIQIAKEHYQNSVASNNIELEKKLKELDDIYVNSLVDFDEETKKHISNLEKIIEENNIKFTKLKEGLVELKNNMKEKMLQESISLNDAIKILSSEKAKAIDDAKIKHNQKLEFFNQEKEKQHDEFSLKMKNIQKDFVITLTSLEESINEIKQNHNKIIDYETRRYHYQMLKLNRLQNIEMAPLNKDRFRNEDEEKQTKNRIKAKNKNFYQLANNLKKQNNKVIKKLEITYQKDFERNRYNKQILEMKKNKALKDITDTEQLKNKRFQEEDNIFNVDLKLAIDLANKKYNQKANIVKNQNQIKNNGFKKDLDLSESIILKQLESITTKNQTIELEIEGCNELSKLVHEFENARYLKTRQYNIVCSLLEIEKFKLLNNYNQVKYKLSIAKAKNDNTREKLRLENDKSKFEAINLLKSEIEKKKIEKENLLLGYNINKMNLLEENNKEIILRKNQYEIDSINQDALFNSFKKDIKCAFIVVSSFCLLIEQISDYIPRILKLLLENTPNQNRKDIAKDYLNIVSEYISLLLDDLSAMQSILVNKRIEFVEKNKYRHFYNSIMLDYETINKKLLTKKKQYEDTLENYNKTRESFTRRMYSLENENSVLKHKIKSKSANKKTNHEKISANNKFILELKTKINEINKSSMNLELELKSINKQLLKNNKKYNQSVSTIKAMQTKYTKAYTNYKKDIISFSEKWKIRIHKIVNCKIYNLYDRKDGFKIDSFINTVINAKDNLDSYLERKLYKITNNFKFESFNDGQKSALNNKYRYERDTKAILSKGYKNLEALNKTHNTQEQKNRNELAAISTKIHKRINEYLLEERNLENDYSQMNRYLMNDQKIELNNFYSNYSSLSDNLNELIKEYTNDINNLETRFEDNKKNCAKIRLLKEEKLNSRLDSFIKNKDELIDKLPVALKMQTSLLNRQIREKNQNITSDIRKSKNEAEIEKRNIIRSISEINESLEQQLYDNERLLQRDLNKEKKNHNNKIHRLNAELKNLQNKRRLEA